MFWNRHRLDDIKLHSWVEGEGRARVRVAVIDDEPVTKASSLHNQGFRLTVLDDVDDVTMLKPFGVVLCDIHGVGRSFGSKYEGAQIIQEIRAHLPLTYVILFSSRTFDTSYNKFFNMCDTQLQKDADISEFIRVIDHGIYVMSDPAERWKRTRAFLIKNGMEMRDVTRLERNYIKEVKKGSPDHLRDSSALSQVPGPIREIVVEFLVGGVVQLGKELLT